MKMSLGDTEIAVIQILKEADAWRDNAHPAFNTRKICLRTLYLADLLKHHTGSPMDARAIAAQLTIWAKTPAVGWGGEGPTTRLAEYLGGLHENIGTDEHGWSLPPDMTG